MRTIALRFSENFAPKEGTIAAHKKVVDDIGFVWYGKLGARVSDKVLAAIMQNEQPRILLINSGKSFRYWAYLDAAQRETPPNNEIPDYYRDIAGTFGYWFKVTRFEQAENNVLSRCRVASSGEPLSLVSKSSMSPYFIIDYEQEKGV